MHEQPCDARCFSCQYKTPDSAISSSHSRCRAHRLYPEHAVHVVSRLKTLSRVNTSIIEVRGSVESVFAGSPTLEESYRRATTQGPIRERGLTQISRAGNPKRQLPNCQAGPTASSTLLILDAQMPCGGHPLWGPLATSLRGLWVSGLLPTYSGGLCARAATRKPPRRELDDSDPGLASRRA